MAKKNDLTANKKIIALLKERNINYRAFAKEIGINPNTFRGYIHSGANITRERLQIIAKGFGVSTSYLLEEELDKKNQLQELLSDLKSITSKISKILESK
ncbi:unknown [Clostridium sp. CAG:798]|nr:unknown [Clostridium sp. CAG:798]